MTLFTLIVVVLANITVNAQSTDADAKTATVKVHHGIFMDPIIPNQGGRIIPVITTNDEWTNVWGIGNHQIPILWWNVVIGIPSIDPFAVFGVNGDKNEPISLTFDVIKPTGISVYGGWARGSWNSSSYTFTAQYPLAGAGVTTGSNSNFALDGASPTAGRNDLGGCWVGAYVSHIKADYQATAGQNAITFTLTAAYTGF